MHLIQILDANHWILFVGWEDQVDLAVSTLELMLTTAQGILEDCP